MDRAKLLERLMATFLGELGDHVQSINKDLLALEREPGSEGTAERFKDLFRAAHSLKGAARAVNVDVIEEACHRLEGILSAVRDDRIALDPALFALLFKTVDAIEESGMRLREQQDLSDSPLSGLLTALDGVLNRLPEEANSREADLPPPTVTQATERRAEASTPQPIETTATIPSPRIYSEIEKNARGTAFVRVPAEKLDALLKGNGELLVARRRVEACASGLAELRDLVTSWDAEWRIAARPLRQQLVRSGPGDGVRPLPHRTVDSLSRMGSRLSDLKEGLDRLAVRMAGDHRQLARAAGTLEDEVRRVRMLPFAEACQGLDRVARDVALESGKAVELIIEGGDVELDRSVLEGLKDPLMHLVRNAVDHGIEPADQRSAAGKTERAYIVVSAALRGAQVEVVIADDGGGIDYEAVRQKARERGLHEPADDRDLADLIFLPGFSTARLLTNVSGRGVGLDVVKSRIEALHGTVAVSTTRGRGTRFILSVPLTLTSLRAILLKASGQIFALASANIQTLARLDPAELRSVEGQAVLARGGPPVPVARLAEVLGLPAGEPLQIGTKVPCLILAAGERRVALVVDELVAEQEIIIKSLGNRIRRARHFSGATILPDGKVALVLNAGSLLRSATGLGAIRTAHRQEPVRKRLLIVDDSVTTRTLEKSILESAGYEVLVAVDGAAGWRMLQEHGADLLISDIEMPIMDGFELAETVRRMPRFAELPIILFTSRGNDRDKARGIEVGADAYIVKGEFDQKDLLETVALLL